MFPREFAPYLVTLLVVALVARRIMKAQEPRKLKLNRLWILPGVLVAVTILTLANGRTPSLLVIGAYVLAAAAGGAFGWFRVHTLEFTVAPDTREISTKASPLGALLLVGLLVFRYGLKYALNLEHVNGAALVRWTDGLLVFGVAILVAQSAHTWLRVRHLLSSTPPAPISGPG
jgi:hypothetical protein